MDWFNSLSTGLLQKNLDGLWLRQQVISDNIANMETPGYKSKVVSFEDELKEALSASDARKAREILAGATPAVTETEDESLRLDGNNVDVEAENIDLARTQLNYYLSLRSLSDEFSRLGIAITGQK